MPVHDVREISLRIFGEESANPIPFGSGSIDLLATKVEELGDRHSVYYRRHLILPDKTLNIATFPIELEITAEKKRMRLRLDADVGTLRLVDGLFHIPHRFEPFFGLRGLDGTRILERDIACFSVLDIEQEPEWTTIEPTRITRPKVLAIPRGDESRRRPSIERVTIPWKQEYRSDRWIDVHYGSAEPRELYRHSSSAMLRSQGTGRRNDQPDTRVIARYFATSSYGWATLAFTGESRQHLRVVRRTEDGGQTWKNDDLFGQHYIVAAAPRDEERAWFVGADRIDTADANAQRLSLYTGRRDGSRLTPVQWPDGFDPELRYLRSITMVSIDADDFIISAGGHGIQHISFDRRLDRATSIGGELVDHASLPDGSTWILHRKRGWTATASGLDNIRHSGYEYRLSRISSDGLTTRTLLLSKDELHRIAFFNESLGAALGASYLLLTVDGGQSWRFLPFTTLPNALPFGHGGRFWELFWVDEEQLRLFMSHDIFDISLADLPPPRTCGPSGIKTIRESSID